MAQSATFEQVVAAILQQAVDVQRDEELGSQRISVQVRRLRERDLQHGDQQEAAGGRFPVPPLDLMDRSRLGTTLTEVRWNRGKTTTKTNDGKASGYHLEEHRGSDGHPVQLDLKGGVEGEVSVIIAAAPFGPVAAVVDVHVQGDCLLLRDGCSCRTEEGAGGGETGGHGAKGKVDGWRDDGRQDGQRSGSRGGEVRGIRMKHLVLVRTVSGLFRWCWI